jgi:hypothetical protein
VILRGQRPVSQHLIGQLCDLLQCLVAIHLLNI